MKVVAVLLTIFPLILCQNFDKANVGVTFGPYTKTIQKENGLIPAFNSYSREELTRMLAVVSTKFKHITTNDVGIASFNITIPVSYADSTALIPQAAAFLNRERNANVIDVAIGVFQNENENIQNSEVNLAIDVAQDANGRFPNTVWGLIFTNDYVKDGRTAEKVLDLISNNKDRARLYNLKVGTRVSTCDQILDIESELYEILSEIAQEIDFIMCNVYPNSSVVQDGSQQAVDAVGNFILSVKNVFRNINEKIDVMIGETGWPSEGLSLNGSPNSIKNFQAYWTGMNEWAKRNSIRTYMFEAFDEPYRSVTTSDAHYGWWYRQSNDDEVYVEKTTNVHVRG
ncbi:uncharacterized protein LOC119078659 [Bradysia coprophila]|uniref:uncharacterized protein LOC119078659 n=1 Tax=Bradysia coprophila TaxID=38358 RepID=UPI00187D71DB|nr:uncharacterized protein LOC119078659 [Bradysia coprophila]